MTPSNAVAAFKVHSPLDCLQYPLDVALTDTPAAPLAALTLPVQRTRRATVQMTFSASDWAYVAILDPSHDQNEPWAVAGVRLHPTLTLMGAVAEEPPNCRYTTLHCPSPLLGPVLDPDAHALYLAGADAGRLHWFTTTEVISVSPEFVDMYSDDTNLTVHGVGFRPGMRCYIGGYAVHTVYCNASTLHCLSRARDMPEDLRAPYCGVPVEVGLPGGPTTQSDRRIFHLAPPRLTAVYPPTLLLGQPNSVFTIHGHGYAILRPLFIARTISASLHLQRDSAGSRGQSTSLLHTGFQVRIPSIEGSTQSRPPNALLFFRHSQPPSPLPKLGLGCWYIVHSWTPPPPPPPPSVTVYHSVCGRGAVSAASGPHSPEHLPPAAWLTSTCLSPAPRPEPCPTAPECQHPPGSP